ncbi:hypothetical protein MCOR25_003802 [Pyricularia grisea]|nr:hypothetical protein MCOR25_003802 [Pyricularia grisea]
MSHPKCRAPNENNSYTLGAIWGHNVVIAMLPKGEYETTTAATVAKDMVRSFPDVRIGLMVGIGGGAPNTSHDIRLGDVVVSSPDGVHGGVFQYDYGKTIQNQDFVYQGTLDKPPQLLRTALYTLDARYEVRGGHQLVSKIQEILKNKEWLSDDYSRPPAGSDRLYRSDVVHPEKGDDGLSPNCHEVCGSDLKHLVSRKERKRNQKGEHTPAIHYGLIASGNRLMKDALIRDKLAAKKGVLCFEMEAAGLMNHFPCLVIRGIGDYSDSHKNKDWQGFTAMMVAAYAKDLLREIAPITVQSETPIEQLLQDVEEKVENIQQTTRDTKAAIDSIQVKNTQKEVLKWIERVVSADELGHIRLFFTSRPDNGFISNIPPLIDKENCIPLKGENIQADIHSYTEARLCDSDFTSKNLSNELQKQIIGKMRNDAEGMFRWAACQLEQTRGMSHHCIS